MYGVQYIYHIKYIKPPAKKSENIPTLGTVYLKTKLP